MIKVTDLRTQKHIYYSASIGPAKAVVNAYEQYEKNNWNTWQYPAPKDHPEYRETDLFVSCGDYCTSRTIHPET